MAAIHQTSKVAIKLNNSGAKHLNFTDPHIDVCFDLAHIVLSCLLIRFVSEMFTAN